MTAALLILGALPFAVGRIQDWYMSANLNSSLPYGVISLAFLSAWVLLAFLMNGNGKRTKQIVIFLNLFSKFFCMGFFRIVACVHSITKRRGKSHRRN